MNRMMVFAALAATAVLLASGCGGDDDDDTGALPSAADTTTQPPEPATLPFGGSHRFPDGLELSIPEPTIWVQPTDEFVEPEPPAGTELVKITYIFTNRSERTMTADDGIDVYNYVGSVLINDDRANAAAPYPVPEGLADLNDLPLVPGESGAKEVLFFIPPGGVQKMTVSWQRGSYGGETISFSGPVGLGKEAPPADEPGPASAPAVCDYDVNGCVPPNMNVGPDGVCTGTPCGSNGRLPRCDEIGLDPSMCGPDGIYRP